MTGRAATLTAAALALGLLVAPSQGGQKDQKEKSANPPQTEKQKSSERRSSAPCEIMPILGDEGDPSALLQETLALLPDKRELESVRRELENAREQFEQTGFTLAGDLDAAFGDHSAAMKELERVRAELVSAQEEIERELAGDDDDGNVIIQLSGDHGWLGVNMAEVTADKAKELKLPAERGVLVKAVQDDSPAAKAGLKAGDVITAFQGQQIEGTVQFHRLVSETPPGRNVTLTVWRDGSSQTLTAQLTGRHGRTKLNGQEWGDHPFALQVPIPPIPPMQGEFHFRGLPGGDLRVPFGFDGDLLGPFTPRIGVDAEDVSGQLAAYFGLPDGEGILIRDVRAGSPAEKAGIKAGDVITTVDGARVKTISDLRARLREKAQSEPGNKEKQEAIKVTVGLLRKGAAMNLNIEIAPVKRSEPGRKVRRVVV